MKTGRHLAAVIALALALQAGPATVARDAPPSAGTVPRTDPSTSLVHRPVVFEPNVGQFATGVRYQANAAGMSLSLTDTAAVLSLGPKPDTVREVRITPVGASGRVRPCALDRLPGVVNHFEGTRPAAWHAGVPTYGRARYRAVYPGIDLVYHGSPEQLEYDFIVGHGADPSRITVRFDGADRVELDPAGDLLIHVGETVIRQHVPYAWQEHGRERRRVEARYRLTNAGDVAFTIGSYDRSLPLVIDPILLYSSYLNAYSSRAAVDAAGYVVVVTEQTPGDYVPLGVKVERLTPDGKTAIYTTLFGANESFPVAGVAATLGGEAILAGWTVSANLPLVNPSEAYPGDTNYGNAFVVKLSPGGGLVFSTYLGGTGEDSAESLSVNGAGTIAVAGSTDSQDFPGIDGLHSGPTKGFVTLFSPSGSRLHGALFPARTTAVAVDAAGLVYVAGTTSLTSWPTTPQSFQPTPSVAQCGDIPGPCNQGVLAKLSADLGSLVYSTYLHTTGQPTREVAISVKALGVDASGAAYILGYTTSTGFTATPGALQEQCPLYACNFLAKLNPAGSARVYSTFLPGFANGLQVDPRGNAYLSGNAYLVGGGFGGGAPTTPNALQPRPADGQVFVSTDGGATWRPQTAPPQAIQSTTLSHGTGAILYAAASYPGGLFRSSDLGNHWDQVDSASATTIYVAPNNPNILYEPGYDRLLRRSVDGGASWALVPSPVDFQAFAVDPVDAQTLYAGGDGTLYKSVNGGYTWSPANSGIAPNVRVNLIVVAPSNRSVLYAAGYTFAPTDFVGLYRSADAGATWTVISPPTGRFGGPVVDPLDAARVYAFDRFNAKLMRTTDSGAHWSVFADCWCSARAVTHTPDVTVFVSTDDGLRRVVDTGATVSDPLPLSLGSAGVVQVTVDPIDPRIMVALVSDGWGGDGFLSVVDPAGARVRYASYFGGTDTDTIATMALGTGGTLAITGRTASRDLPLMNPRIAQRSTRDDSFVALMRVPLPTVVIDAPGAGPIAPPFTVSGWAIDSNAASGPGIDAVHVWALPQAGGAPTFVGAASYGAARPDVGAASGAQFTNSGFSLTGGLLPAGPYTLAAFARSTVSGTFDAAIRSVQVLASGRMNIDTPAAGTSLYQPFTIAGWAFDTAAPSGTGIDTVHVWAYPATGPPQFVGAATYGFTRPDVGAAFGSRFAPTGFTLQSTGLAPGDWTFAVFARSTVSGAFDLVRTVRIAIPNGAAAWIDTPVTGSVVSTPFVLAGWAIDRQGAGTGVDTVHIWAYPAAGAPTFLGVATSVSRPDVAAAFGDPRFEPGGYSVTVNSLPPGTYTVVVYAHSVVTGAFSIVRTVQVNVN